MTRQQTFPAVKPKSGESAERTHSLVCSVAAFVLVGMGEKFKTKYAIYKINYLFKLFKKITILDN